MVFLYRLGIEMLFNIIGSGRFLNERLYRLRFPSPRDSTQEYYLDLVAQPQQETDTTKNGPLAHVAEGHRRGIDLSPQPQAYRKV
jgi:hypothetical protein